MIHTFVICMAAAGGAAAAALAASAWSWSCLERRGGVARLDVEGAARSGAVERRAVALGLRLFAPEGEIVEWEAAGARRWAHVEDVAHALVCEPRWLTGEAAPPPCMSDDEDDEDDDGPGPAGGAPVGPTARAFFFGFGLALLALGYRDGGRRGAAHMALGAASAAACVARLARGCAP